MERKICLLIAALLVLCTSLVAQSKSVYTAYISGNMLRWKQVVDSIEAKTNKTNKELFEIVNYEYGYIAWCISKKKSKEAQAYLVRAQKKLLVLEQRKQNISMIYAYKAAFVGFEIGMAPYKAPFIGPQSLDFAKKSISQDSTNAIAYFQLGNIAYYTPAVFGGSKTEAVEHYKKALKLMEKNKEYLQHNWNYLNLLATIIKAHIELGFNETARKYCIKTLKTEPNFEWVKNDLYPKTLKK